MMQITEDTPPDMLAGAMDLTVHLPTGRTVKMSVDRSTPMMDLLVQITTAHHLQQSGHTLQALEMAPSSGHMDRILPYKPNTPIGVLDTQHVKVFPKNRSTSIHKSVSTGHQPFESTFRLQVHLPRNQLYVIRVSQNVHLEDIMKKVCHEKNLDSTKYECRHPGNLNEVLDPKLTLSDYQITEVYIVFKGTVGLTQAFSANDIMALRKEEERKQLQARTGGGVFSLIFKRGKQSTGSGSLSSENRSISPSHSDDSRSVTPPAIQQQILSARTQDKSPLKDKPKAPQRKRRPAPKPPQQSEDVKDLTEKPLSQISNISDTNTSDIHPKKFDSGLTICHSRNSSDSSGYHEPSVLSENCNTSLPRRPKSTLINEVVDEEVQFGENSQNLTKMSAFSKSTSSITSRKKKAAPPPPQIQTPVPELTVANIESASTVVANVIVEKQEEENKAAVADSDINVATSSSSDIPVNIIKTSPVPVRRKKYASKPPKPAPRVKSVIVEMPIPQARNSVISIEETLQLDADENCNLLPNSKAFAFEKSISDSLEKDDKNLLQIDSEGSEKKTLFDDTQGEASTQIFELQENAPENTNELQLIELDKIEDTKRISVVGSSTESDLITFVNEVSESGIKENRDVEKVGVIEKSPITTGATVESELITLSSANEVTISNDTHEHESLVSLLDSNNSRKDDTVFSDIQNLKQDDGNDENMLINKAVLSFENENKQEEADHTFNLSSDQVCETPNVNRSEPSTLISEVDNKEEFATIRRVSSSLSLQVEHASSTKPPEVVEVMHKSKSLNHLSALDCIDSLACSSIIPLNIEEQVPNTSNESNADDSFPDSVSNSFLRRSSIKPQNLENEVREVQSLHSSKRFNKNKSILSLRNSESVPNFLDRSNIKKWNNTQELDHISINSDCTDLNLGKWRIGDYGDSDESSPQPTTNNIFKENFNASKKVSVTSVKDDLKNNLESTTVQEPPKVRSQEIIDDVSNKAVEPNIVSSRSSNEVTKTPIGNDTSLDHSSNKNKPETLVLNLAPESSQIEKQEDVKELAELDNDWHYQLPSPPKAFRDLSPTNLTDVTNYDTVTLECFKNDSVLTNPELFEKLVNIKDGRYETGSISDLSSTYNEDEKQILSKLTLENLEKRKSLVYNRELSTSLKIAQDNDFSSRTNETRSKDDTSSKRSNVVNELERVIKSNSRPLVRHNSCVLDTTLKPYIDNNLPNFKISTYDNLQRKINIFEDESIRSNVENSFGRKTSVELPQQKPYKGDDKSFMRRSMENIANLSFQVDESEFKKPTEFNKHKASSKNNFYVKHKNGDNSNVARSGSFSANHEVHSWKPLNPVQRSLSQLDLNKHVELREFVPDEVDSNLAKSNSSYDVSGLHSLGVMRSIQNKLNTPNTSTEQLLCNESNLKQNSYKNSVSLEQNSIQNSRKSSIDVQQTSPTIVTTTQTESTTSKTYRYQGPPSINLSTWSERPKTKISLKEDTDYKIKNVEGTERQNVMQKPHLTTFANFKNQETKNVNIKINGMEPITAQESGNVVIKIGNSQFPKLNKVSHKFNENVEVRKPLGNINKINLNSRPHSVAFDSDFDISRVPIVRAVELKKTINDSTNNTSVTQINALNDQISSSNNKYADIYHSSGSLQEVNGLKGHSAKSSVYLSSESPHKPVVRGNSFAYSRTVPKIMGFKDIKIENDNTPRSRKSWNIPNSFESLPLKIKPDPPMKPSTFTPNSNVPFSQVTLKRVESHKINLSVNNNNTFGNIVLRNSQPQFKREEIKRDAPAIEANNKVNSSRVVPPAPRPPPLMPTVAKKVVRNSEPCIDARDELLSSIRNFGGKKGLRRVKAV